MKKYLLTHASDGTLLRDLKSLVTQDRAAAAEGRSKSEIEKLLAERFPQDDLPFRMVPIPEPVPVQVIERPASELAAEPVGEASHSRNVLELSGELAPGPIEELASHQVAVQPGARPAAASIVRPRMTPIAPDRVALQVTIRQSAADKLQYAQELLGFRIQHGDVSEVLERALDALIVELEKQKFAATGNPRAARRRASSSERYVPSRVKRQVWKRDQGRCTFVSATGHRCASREDLQFDHVEAVARGGTATVANVRLLCRAHNQYMAECTFGAEFMKAKRQRTREERETCEDGLARKAGQTRDIGVARESAATRRQQATLRNAASSPTPPAPL